MLILVQEVPTVGREYDFNIPASELNQSGEMEPDCKVLKSVHFTGTAYRSGLEVRITGNLSTCIEVSCHRCLASFPFNIDTQVELFYQPSPPFNPKDDREINIHELGILHYENNAIDLSQAIHDTIILEIPMKILCKEDCRGLCSRCGQNLNQQSCSCHTSDISNDTPFKKFFETYHEAQ